MKQKNFHVSIKTIDGMPVFPPAYDGQKLLFPFVMQAAMRVGVLSVGFASFPDGVEVVVKCSNPNDAKNFADSLSSLIYDHNNALGHIIDSFGINIGELAGGDDYVNSIMMDMMVRSMIARGEMDEVSDSSDGSDKELFHIDIDLNDPDNSTITPLGKPGKGFIEGFRPGTFKSGNKKPFS
jgi:hypothetical protein